MPASRRPGPAQAGLAFEEPAFDSGAPLAARMRPRTLDEFAGQEKAIGRGSMLRSAVARGTLPSIILWGPPGCGKTTLAVLLTRSVGAVAVSLSAVASGVPELRRVLEESAARKRAGVRTVLFIDEIHRFNKAQQDVVLPAVENGTVVLIGATTENPSFEVVAPLLSRVRVVRLHPLADSHLEQIVRAAFSDTERGVGGAGLELPEEGLRALVAGSGGDARAALNALEVSVNLALAHGRPAIGGDLVQEALQERRPYHDKGADFHYDTVSAFIKSLRGSDPNAALYWLARMLEAGEDPLFIVRRMVILAAEDVGLADPQALVMATACQQAVHFVGMPEGHLPLAECALYLALAPKSNSACASYARARADAAETAHLPVPLHLRNATTGLMRSMGYGQGYRYAHDEPGHYARGMQYVPDGLEGREYYVPGGTGFEAKAVERLRALRARNPGGMEESRGHGEGSD